MIFFFSSRRRHTRLTCDWSSDVCSSDLAGGPAGPLRPGPHLSQVAVRQERAALGLRPLRARRSEEHTSELQSHVNLVCRLLLEKKKKTMMTTFTNVSHRSEVGLWMVSPT